jgi:aspartate/methionine/tyrosine aminotransferase
VLVDEVFREMCHRRPPKAAFELGDNGISTNGMSKLWGLGGLRVGWLIGPEDVVEKVTETRLYSSWHLPVRSMALAVKAIERRRWFRERVLEAARRKLPLILDWAAGERRASITEPQGCLHLLIHLPEGTDDERFALRLLNRHGVAVCPGRYFGEGGSIRVTYSCGGEDLADGLEAISSTLGPS